MFNLLSERKYKVSLKWKDMFYILFEQLFKATDWISCKIKKKWAPTTDFPSKHVPYIVPPVTFAPRLISATIGVKVSMSIGYPDAKR